MKILFHRPTPWSNNINCSTKIYSKIFSEQGHEVAYLQSNINLLHWITKKGYYKTWKEGNRIENNIIVICLLSLLPYLDKIPFFSNKIIKYSYRLCIPSIKSILLKFGFGEPDIIWTTIPGSTVLKDIFPKAKLVFHSVDNYAAYRGGNVINIESVDYNKSDHIFVIGESIKNQIIKIHKQNSRKITNLGQGVFLENYKDIHKKPEDIKKIEGPIAIWVGVLKKIDVFYLKEVLNCMKTHQGNVVLIGPKTLEFEVLEKQNENLILLGAKSSEDVPKYLLNSDIGLMLYNRDNRDVYAGQHPLKLYEYAAAGIPILSTWHEEYDTLKPPVLMIEKEEDIENALFLAIKESKIWRKKTLDFVSNHDWLECYEKAIQKIDKLI